jgi:hypothetical protein
MLTSDDFSTYVADLFSGTYDCVDRISVRGYFRLGQTSGGLLTWWNKLFPNTALSEQQLRKLAGDFARRVHASARKHKIPLRYFAIFVAKAPALVWQAKNNDAGEIVLRRGKNWPLTCAKLRGKSLVDGLAKRAATECDGTVSGRWRHFGSCASK